MRGVTFFQRIKTPFTDSAAEEQARYQPRMWVVGEALQERREELGLELDEIGAMLRIKPAYLAAQNYYRQLAGYRFKEKLKTDSLGDYLLSFAKENGESPCFVAWTTVATPHEVKIPVPNGTYEIISYDGKKRNQADVMNGALTLTVDGGPQYIKPSTMD